MTKSIHAAILDGIDKVRKERKRSFKGSPLGDAFFYQTVAKTSEAYLATSWMRLQDPDGPVKVPGDDVLRELPKGELVICAVAPFGIFLKTTSPRKLIDADRLRAHLIEVHELSEQDVDRAIMTAQRESKAPLEKRIIEIK